MLVRPPPYFRISPVSGFSGFVHPVRFLRFGFVSLSGSVRPVRFMQEPPPVRFHADRFGFGNLRFGWKFPVIKQLIK